MRKYHRRFGPSTSIIVNDGIIYAYDNGEWGAEVIWRSKYSQPLLHQIYYFISKKSNPIKTTQIISDDHLTGFLNTRYGVLGYGGFSHLSINDGGYVVKFYKADDIWKSKRIIRTKEHFTSIKESDNGLELLLGQYSLCSYKYVNKKFIKEGLVEI